MRALLTNRPLLWSPVLALVAQLVLVAAAAACSNGGGFPQLQR